MAPKTSVQSSKRAVTNTATKKKGQRTSTLSALISSDAEEESGGEGGEEEEQEEEEAAPPPADKPKRGRPPKAKPAATDAASSPAAAVPKKRTTKAKPTEDADDAEEPPKKKPGRKPKAKPAAAEGDETGDDAAPATTAKAVAVEVKGPVKRGRPPSAATLAKREKAAAAEKEKSGASAATTAAEKPAPVKKAPAARKKKTEVQEIAETQLPAAEAMEVDGDESEPEIAPTPTQVHSKGRRGGRVPAAAIPEESDEEEGSGEESEVSDDEDELSAPQPKKSTAAAAKSKPATAASKSKRTTLAVDRFKLKSLTETEPERLLREFRATSSKEAAAAEKTIQTLQKELDRQSALALESRNLQAQLDAQAKETQKLQAKIAELTKALADEKKENTILSAKLSAAKSGNQGMGGPPGSAVKPKMGGIGGMGMMGKEEDWVKKEKVQLFEDLTNLIILSAKKDSKGSTFECLQSGRNGTLHFKLCVRDPNRQRAAKKPKAPQAAGVPAPPAEEEDDEDEDFIFIPQLDPARDAFVISILPDYLRGEIAFTRENAANFYNRINKVLAQQIVEVASDEEEEEEEDEEGEYETGEEESGEEGEGEGDTEMGDAATDEE